MLHGCQYCHSHNDIFFYTVFNFKITQIKVLYHKYFENAESKGHNTFIIQTITVTHTYYGQILTPMFPPYLGHMYTMYVLQEIQHINIFIINVCFSKIVKSKLGVNNFVSQLENVHVAKFIMFHF